MNNYDAHSANTADFDVRFVRQVAAKSACKRNVTRIPMTSAVLMLMFGGLVLALGAATMPGSSLFSHDAPAAGVMCSFMLDALQKNDIEEALLVCGDGPAGQKALAMDNARVYKGKSDSRESAMLTDDLDALQALHTDLAGKGLDWSTIKPLAFAGASAEVRNKDIMKAPTRMLIGKLYFTQAENIYFIEITARAVEGVYFIQDLWEWDMASVTPETIDDVANTDYRAFKTANSGKSNTKVTRIRRVFQDMREK